MEVAKDRQCRRAWWEFLLALFVEIREENFDEKKNGNRKEDSLEGDRIIHGKSDRYFV